MDSLVPPTHDTFECIARIQAQKEQAQKRYAKTHSRGSSSFNMTTTKIDQDVAARMIQRTFRGYQARREMNGLGLNAGSRWLTTVRDAQFREANQPRPRSQSNLLAGEADDEATGERPRSAWQNWKKAGLVARRAGHDDSDSDSDLDSASSPDDDEQKAAWREKRRHENAVRKQAARMMGLQYFLEMIDVKHRYGSNLRSYHEEWKKADTNENFFYWLDYGEGRYMELDACPRERLEREQVRYLSRDERQYYLVKVDADGRLCWAKNNARIDTTEEFKDSIHGIVPADDPTPAFNPSRIPQDDDQHDDSASDSSIESRLEADRAAKYATPAFDNATGFKKVTHVSASTIFNKLLRKSVRKNTWIFVADTSFRLYVGIKSSGAFQHSSFLQGGRISAAGLIKVKNGRLTSLSPLSGHYRPPAANFRAFLKSLKSEGVDMRRLTVSKSYAVLVGLETYVNTHKKSKHFVERLLRQQKKVVAPEKAKKEDEATKDQSQSAQKEREVLEAEQQQREDEEGKAVTAMKKMSLSTKA